MNGRAILLWQGRAGGLASHVAGCSVLLRARGEQHCDSHPLHNHTGTRLPLLFLAILSSVCFLLPPSPLHCYSGSYQSAYIHAANSRGKTWRRNLDMPGICHQIGTIPVRGRGSFSFFLAGCAVLHARSMCHTHAVDLTLEKCMVLVSSPFNFCVSPWWRHCMPSKS